MSVNVYQLAQESEVYGVVERVVYHSFTQVNCKYHLLYFQLLSLPCLLG